MINRIYRMVILFRLKFGASYQNRTDFSRLETSRVASNTYDAL